MENTDMYKGSMEQPTEKQLSFIKGICDVLELTYSKPKTKTEASEWLKYHVPEYRKRCNEYELEWEANNSDLVDNCGDWE